MMAEDNPFETDASPGIDRPIQFSLRTIFLIMTVAAVILGFATAWVYAVIILLAIAVPLGWLAVELMGWAQKVLRENWFLGAVAMMCAFVLANVSAAMLFAAALLLLTWVARWLAIPFI